MAEYWVKNSILVIIAGDVVYLGRERERERERWRISLTHLSLSKNAPLFFCCRAFKQIKIWALLSFNDVKIMIGHDDRNYYNMVGNYDRNNTYVVR